MPDWIVPKVLHFAELAVQFYHLQLELFFVYGHPFQVQTNVSATGRKRYHCLCL